MLKFWMIEETGTIKSISGIMAVVSVPRKSACEGCSAGTCSPGDSSMEIEALNKARGHVGQRVRVSIRPSLYLKGSLMVYGIPAFALVAGAVIGKELLSRLFKGLDPDMLSAFSGFAALGLSFVGVKWWSSRASGTLESKPVITEILD